jgi:hypothetical protein
MVGYNNKFVACTSSTKFLRMSLNETLSWDKHIEVLAKKWSMACYIVRSTKIYMISSLKIIYYAFLHSLMTCEIIFIIINNIIIIILVLLFIIINIIIII